MNDSWIMLPEKLRAEKFPVQPDGTAAARAVACVKLEKPAQRPQPSPAAADMSACGRRPRAK